MSARAFALSLAALAGLFVAACRPDLGDPPSRVTATRILAVVAEPPEAAPNAEITFRVLAVGPAGALDTAGAAWSFCAAPKPLTENDTVSAACFDEAARRPFESEVPRAPIPSDACALFGPDAPPGGFRPRDPDETGGFYQPVRVALGAEVAFALPRIRCNLANASADVATLYRQLYVANRNPHLLAPRVALDAVAAGARVTLDASWPAEDAETYVAFDPSTQRLVTRREAMRVSWFSPAGELETAVTGRAEGDLATSTENVWTAPRAPGTYPVWVVLRDSRGGATYAEDRATVVP